MTTSEPAPIPIHLIAAYYRNKFPTDNIAKWLEYNGEEPGDRRELGFFFSDSRFFRWRTIPEMKGILSEFIRDPPERMEIGPIYSHPISQKGITSITDEFKAVHRELIFDIDSDSFADIKECCKDSEICEKCWPLMHCALDCFVKVLGNNFGFKHFLPVFSGRRGIHIWTCDKKARELDPTTRGAVVRYFDIISMISEKEQKSIKSIPLVQDVLPICEKHFSKLIKLQPIFYTSGPSDSKLMKRTKEIIGIDSFNKVTKALYDGKGNQVVEWKDVRNLIPEEKRMRLVLVFTYMRLDAHVTSGINHLLKSPFSVHPKSGLISVPIPKERFGVLPSIWAPSLEKLISGDADANNEYEQRLQQFETFVNEVCDQNNK